MTSERYDPRQPASITVSREISSRKPSPKLTIQNQEKSGALHRKERLQSCGQGIATRQGERSTGHELKMASSIHPTLYAYS